MAKAKEQITQSDDKLLVGRCSGTSTWDAVFRAGLPHRVKRATILLYMVISSWWWESWRILWPTPWLDSLLAVVAVICGLIIGTERQRREKPAGLRTLSLVCLGSAIFTMISFAFTTTTGDSGRVAAQIVTGIGFLGAGVILRGERKISGATTAASIWITAAIGMTVGAGYVIAGLGLSLLVNRLLVGIFLYETRWHSALRNSCVVLDYEHRNGITRLRLERILVDYSLHGAAAVWSEPGANIGRLTLSVRLAPIHFYELLAELVEVPEVCAAKQVSVP